jgi:hypothetical protein
MIRRGANRIYEIWNCVEGYPIECTITKEESENHPSRERGRAIGFARPRVIYGKSWIGGGSTFGFIALSIALLKSLSS